METLVNGLLWANLQAGILAALVLLPAVVVAVVLRGRLPVWRKGLWLGAVLLPILLVAASLMLPADTRMLPSSWLGPAAIKTAPAGVAGLAHDHAAVAASHVVWAVYGAWVLAMLLVEAVAALRLRALLGRSRDVRDGGTIALYSHLAKQVGCRRAPRLVQSDDVAAPFIVAQFGQGLTIVLPSSLLSIAASGDAIRAVLAHELAHARAGDPWWQRAAGLVRAVFPLPWVCGWAAARSCWEDAAEETSDLRAIRASGLDGRTYAGVLKDLALADPAANESDEGAPYRNSAIALGFNPQNASALSPAAQELGLRLVRRVSGLRLASRWSEPLAMSAAACCRAAAALGLLALLLRYADLGSVLHDPWLAERPRLAAAAPIGPAPDAAQFGHVPIASEVTKPIAPAATVLLSSESSVPLSKLPPGIRRRFETAAPAAPTGSDVAPTKPGKGKKGNSK